MLKKMTNAQLIEIIVPATIVQWTAQTPQFNHTGKTASLRTMYKGYSKKDLIIKYDYLVTNGFII